MKLNSKKELTPVVFGETSVKVISSHYTPDTAGFEAHWHDRIEFHLVKSGTLNLLCNGNEISVNTGELSIISPTVLHSGKSGDEGVDYYVLAFDINELCNQALSTHQFLEPIIKGKIQFVYKTDIPQIVQLASQIVKMNLNRKEYHPLETVGCLYELLGLLCRFCINTKYLPQQNSQKFDTILNYINSNFQKKIPVSMISKIFGYDEAYFCRKFKKETGITVTNYIKTQRLEFARQMIEKSDETIHNIAISCGFSDTAYFTKCFKDMYGNSPTKYRNKIYKETKEK